MNIVVGTYCAGVSRDGADGDHVTHIEGMHHEEEDDALKERFEHVAEHEGEGEQHAAHCHPDVLEVDLCMTDVRTMSAVSYPTLLRCTAAAHESPDCCDQAGYTRLQTCMQV